MEKKFDAVLLDFDGTFADTGVGIFNSVRVAIAAMNMRQLDQKQLRTFIGPPIHDSFKRELGLTDEQCDFAVQKYREVYGKRGIYQFEVYKGIPELVARLRENGIKVAIASAKPERFILKIFNFLKLTDELDFISATKSDSADEDKCTLINRAVEALGVDKSRVLMVGDRHFDINGAKAAGVKSAGVTYGYGTREELRGAGATYIAESVDELADIILS